MTPYRIKKNYNTLTNDISLMLSISSEITRDIIKLIATTNSYDNYNLKKIITPVSQYIPRYATPNIHSDLSRCNFDLILRNNILFN